MNPFRFLYFQLYLLQLNEYDLLRTLKSVIATKGLPPKQLKKKLIYTPKIVLILVLTMIVDIAFVGIVTQLLFSHYIISFRLLFFFSFFISLHYLLPYYLITCISLSTLLTLPFDFMLKKIIIHKARTKLKQLSYIKIIGIVGSYGKTTMKEVVYSVLSQKFKVAKTDKSINTPLGIAQFILRDVKSDTDICIVEMGEYVPGDIKKLCAITPPDIGIVTGINEAHFERMGSLENAVKTIFEIADGMKSKTASLILNMNDKHVAKNYKRFTGDHKIIPYGMLNTKYLILNTKFHTDGSGISFTLKENLKIVGDFKLPVLAKYILDDIVAACLLDDLFDLSFEQIANGIRSIKPVSHRLEPIVNKQTGVLVIDDSYNGNPEGVGEAIRVLSRFGGMRKIYITPGLVEMGASSEKIHYNIGKDLARVADIVILIKNSVTPFIEKGLRYAEFAKDKIYMFASSQKMQDALPKILQANDVVLFQNDWPENYV